MLLGPVDFISIADTPMLIEVSIYISLIKDA